MATSKLTRLLLPLPLCLLGSCESWLREIVHEEMASLRTKTVINQMAVRKVSGRLDQLEGHLAYCSDEVKALLSKVQKECLARDVCTPNDANIQVEVLRIDPSKQGRFLSLFQERKHLAFYFPDRPRPLTDVEKKSLRDLIKPTWLDDGERRTRFLVVSNVEDSSKGSLKRAEGRSWNVIDAIAEISRDIQPIEPPPENLHESVSETPRRAAASGKGNHILLAAASRTTILPSGRTPSAAPVASPPGAAAGTQLGSESTAASPDGAAKDIVRKGRVLNWIFPFSVPGETLRPEDRPNVKLDDKLARSVWVYRVDC